jgi:hypothetical protein
MAGPHQDKLPHAINRNIDGHEVMDGQVFSDRTPRPIDFAESERLTPQAVVDGLDDPC